MVFGRTLCDYLARCSRRELANLESNRAAAFGDEGVEVALRIMGDFTDPNPVPEPEVEPEPEKEPEQLPPPPEIPPIPVPEPTIVEIPEVTESVAVSPPEIAEIPIESPPPQLTIPDFSSMAQQATTGSGNSDQLGDSKKYSKSYLARVAARINRHKKYPKTSRRAKEEGRVELSLVVYSDGSVDQVKLVESSGFEELDAEALRIVERATPFPRFPNSLRRRNIDEISFRTSINFSLTD